MVEGGEYDLDFFERTVDAEYAGARDARQGKYEAPEAIEVDPKDRRKPWGSSPVVRAVAGPERLGGIQIPDSVKRRVAGDRGERAEDPMGACFDDLLGEMIE